MMNQREILDELARYKYVMENIKDVIWEVDTQLVFTFLSPTIKAMTGHEVDEMLGKCIIRFLTPESQRYIQEQLSSNIFKNMNGERKSHILYDVEFICKHGDTIWCEVSVKPIYNNDEVIGYIGTTRDISEKKLYENRLKNILEEQQNKNELLENIVTFDMLTGAYNRRKFDYYITQEINNKVKYGYPFSIIMFDIDNFKKINDCYGHKKGDSVLQDMTAFIKNSIRSTDKLFRWGGDEFIILLPSTPLKDTYKIANKIRKTVMAFTFDVDEKVTISLGVGEHILNETIDQIVNRVDNALLKAKYNGRNNVEQC